MLPRLVEELEIRTDTLQQYIHNRNSVITQYEPLIDTLNIRFDQLQEIGITHYINRNIALLINENYQVIGIRIEDIGEVLIDHG